MCAKPNLDTLDARALARALLDGDRVDIAPVRTMGMNTHAYRVDNGGRAWCLRIGGSIQGFARDRWAHQKLGDKLSVPRVFEIGHLDDRSAFCLSEWMPGETLQDLTAADVDRVLPAVFQAWSTMSGCDISNISGYGAIDTESEAASHESWQAWLRHAAEHVHYWDDAWTASRTGSIARLLRTYDKLIDLCPDVRRLVHGDWGCNNMLADGPQVTGVLDWDKATIGDPLYDVARRFWATWPPVATCVTRQADYCDHLFGNAPNYRNRVLCYDLHTGLGEIGDALADGDHKLADWALARCIELAQQGT